MIAVELTDAVIQLENPDGSTLLILPVDKYVQATCCNGRMTAMVVERGGVTQCVNCDCEKQEQLAHDEAERQRLSTAIAECPYVIE